MTNIPCSFPPSLCQTETNPLTGFSSEATDSESFIGLAWGSELPSLGANINVFPCFAICDPPVSQEDADLCAERMVAVCEGFSAENTAQTCSAECPDGLPFFFTVPAGLFVGQNQISANRSALSLACNQVLSHQVCLSSLQVSEVCSGNPYSQTITATGGNELFNFSIISGVLPPGITMFSSGLITALISGTCHIPGDYRFTVEASASDGSFMIKQYLISIQGISNVNSLPRAQAAANYSAPLILSATPQGSQNWKVSAGALPGGLNLDPNTGIISGVPSTAGTFDFSVTFSDSAVSCQTPLEIVVHAPDFILNLAAWYKLDDFPPGTVASGQTMADSSGNNNPMIAGNGNSWVLGRGGFPAFQVYGISLNTPERREVFVPFTNIPFGQNPWSMTMWVRRDTLTPMNSVGVWFGFGDASGPGSRALIVRSGNTAIGFEDLAGGINYPLPGNTQFHFYAFTWPGGNISLTNMKCYIDNVLQGQIGIVDVAPNIPTGNRDICLSGAPGQNPTPGGDLDEVTLQDCRIYNIALTAGNVNDIFNANPV